MKTVLKLSLAVLIIVTVILLIVFDVFNRKAYEKENPVLILVNKVKYLSLWDAKQQYRITPFISKQRLKINENDVTLVTQCSYHNLHLLLKLIEFWQGPISIAVLAEMDKVLDVLEIVANLRQCYHNFAVYVNLHLVVYEGDGNFQYEFEKEINCSGFLEIKSPKSSNYQLASPYPVNLMRNVARMNMSTNYFFLIDIDMVPSMGLRQNFLDMIRNSPLDKDSIYIVPAFELKEKLPLPETKYDVKKLLNRKAMRPFYAEVCFKCHSCVDYQAWTNLPQSSGLATAYITLWKDPCEPFYISSKDIPLYDESFKQYGFNRISQVCELYVAGYTFAVLDNAFLTHLGWKTKESFHKGKQIEQEINKSRFKSFKETLKFKYPSSPRRC